jgi:hypothetical protein
VRRHLKVDAGKAEHDTLLNVMFHRSPSLHNGSTGYGNAGRDQIAFMYDWNESPCRVSAYPFTALKIRCSDSRWILWMTSRAIG